MGEGMGPCFAKEGREKGDDSAGKWVPVRRIGRGAAAEAAAGELT